MAMLETVGETSACGLREQIRGLSETIREAQPGFDAARQIPDDLYRKLAATGVFRIWLPSGMGGAQLSPLEFMDVVEEAAAIDGAVGWLVGNGGGMSRTGAYLPTDPAQEIFREPDAFVVSGTAGLGKAVPVEGGFRVTGRWPFGSGSPHATWFSPFCEVTGEGSQAGQRILVYAPRKDVILHDNWYVSGLCGTGSGDFEFDDVFVPDCFVHPYQPDPTHEGTLYRLPTISTYIWTVATVPLGIAKGAMSEVLRIAGQRKRKADKVPLAERELVQSDLGRIQARLGAARAYMREGMAELLAAVETGIGVEAARVRYRLGCTYASETALTAIGQLTEIVGAASIMRSSPLERFERDARAAAKHTAMSPNLYITAGKYAVGQNMSGEPF